MNEAPLWLDDLPIWAVAVLLVAGFSVAAEIGFAVQGRLARHTNRANGDASDEAQVLSTALLLLALLLGFSFSMALGRYDARRAEVVQEANDIGTAWLRAGLVDSAAARTLQSRLAEYAGTRIATPENTNDRAIREARMARGAALRTEIWSLTAAATAPERSTAGSASLVSALNAVLDTATRRSEVLAARVPNRVVTLLIGYAGVSAFLLGYVLGAYGAHHRIATLLLFVLLAMTIALILDLDRPQGGGIQVSQQALVDLVADIGRPSSKVPVP